MDCSANVYTTAVNSYAKLYLKNCFHQLVYTLRVDLLDDILDPECAFTNQLVHKYVSYYTMTELLRY